MSDSSAVTVEVALRVRPLVQNEIARGCQQCVESDGSGSQVVVRGNRYFAYNYVFGTDDTQTYFYETAVKKLVNRLFHGYNVTILAYGQTGSGKTYSMGTCYSGEKDAGIIPRSIKDIFDTVAQKSDWEFNITVSFMELYKEQLYDLLADNRNPVEIREENKEIRVLNLTEVAVLNADDTTKCLMQGSAGRATGATAMNTQSSRSHAIFTITIHQQKIGDINSAMTAKFHLVDLAGSERSKKTQATGERFKEGIDINKGLLALGNVISALGEEGQRGFISYRDSKLTRLLQDSLGGNSITLMIACVSPADYNLDETMSTLRYADRARRIKNKPVINQDARAAELAKYKLMVRELQLELANRGITGGLCPPEHQLLALENGALVAKNRCLTESLNDALSEATYLVERALMAEMSRERMKTKLCELQAEYGQTMEHLNLTMDQTVCPATFLEQVHKLKDIQLKIQDLQAEQKRGTDEILKHEISNASVCKPDGPQDDAPYSADFDQRHELHAIEQQGLNKELQELNRALALKEELALKMAANSHHMRNIQPSESNMKEMEEQIATLQQEKDRLVLDLKSMQVNANSSKVAESRRKRLQELELKIASLTKKVNEQAKVIKMNEQADKKIVILNGEIQSMKHAKVALIRQMRSGNEEFRDWKKKRLQEISRLKDQDRKRQVEMVRMERLHTKQQNVLKRKWEEAASANKRLKDALAVQKQNKDRRMNNASTLNKVQTWLSQELEVAVSTVEAQRTLEQLLDDRASLCNEHGATAENLKDKSLSPSARCDMEKERKQLEEDIELRNMQIDDLQQKIMDSDQANKCKSRWDTVTCMLEAKCAMNYLFELVTDAKKELSNKDYKLKELEDAHLQAVSKLEHYEQQLRNSENAHKEKVMSIEKEHEEKLFVLLRQLNGMEGETNQDGSEHLSDREKILHDEFEKLESMKEELEKRDAEIRELKSKMSSSDFNKSEPALFAAAVALPKSKAKKTKSVPSEEYELDFEDDSFEEFDCDSDPDWKKTPIFRRMQKIKTTNASRSSTASGDQTFKKRNSDGQVKCKCRGLCRNKVCSCQKNSARCNKDCKCDNTVCENQENKDAKRNILNDMSNGSNSEDNQGEEDSFKKPRLQPLKENISMVFNSTTPFKKPRLTEGTYFAHDII